ncbi:MULTISPECIES: hypothetical protein [Enterococcus]|uniref:hypothetical protein n=1 Tax=Enterococcus TaxID=1350 RepID=UPI0007C1BB52|nr:hypothetical protein [Enterococcus hirae]AND72608.1 hypothetical protein A6P53_06950 [Enterococcus hirae]
METNNGYVRGKEKVLNYLYKKQKLTAAVQDAKYDLSVTKNNFLELKRKYRNYFILMIIGRLCVGLLLLSNEILLNIWGVIWLLAVIVLIVSRVRSGKQAKLGIQAATQNLYNEQNDNNYLAGMNDFPQKFYSYWIIDRLINLIKENRAITFQEAFNIAENQDFQNDQLALQQQNLAVAKSTNTMASISAAANVGTFLNTSKK